MKKKLACLFTITYLVGCSTVQEYQPVVDPRSIQNQPQYSKDRNECKVIVDQVDYSSAENQAALLGGVAGAGIVAGTTSALVGLTGGVVFWPVALPLAAAAAVFGGSKSSNTIEEKEQKMRAVVWNSCLVDRGYTVYSAEGVPLSSDNQGTRNINQVSKNSIKEDEDLLDSSKNQLNKKISNEKDAKRQALEEELKKEAEKRRMLLEKEILVEEERREAEKNKAEEEEKKKAEEADLRIKELEEEIKRLKIQALEDELKSIKHSQNNEEITSQKSQEPNKDIYISPKVSKAASPIYSKSLQENGVEGEVIVTFNISKDGNVINLDIKQSSGYAQLDASALKAMRDTVFIPATLNGNRVDSRRLQRTVSFTLVN